jgi:formylglycine-generating enzyme required for sulfatase activity
MDEHEPETLRLERILTGAFNDWEFDRFCFHYFREVHRGFTQGMERGPRVLRLIEYCETRGYLPQLWERLRQERQEWFQKQVPPPTPPPVVEPPADRRPRPWFAAVGAVLALLLLVVGGGWLVVVNPPWGNGESTGEQASAEGNPLSSSPTVPTDTPVPPTPTPTNPLFPVTVEEWRREVERSNETFGECDGYWCYVPGGTYSIGGWLDDEEDDNDAQAEVELSPYWVAKHPVTVQQYRQFMEAGGYEHEEWWTPQGWVWKTERERTQPYLWGDERFRGDNQPVIGVSWYEAAAFARWLTVQLAGTLPEGHCVRLPTEAEWEAACAYDGAGNRSTYPWGDSPEPDAARADFGKDWQTDRPAPVGERPAGAAPCGAQEMVGSVREWTATPWESYAAGSGAAEGDFVPGAWVSLRGGSWGDSSTYVRCGSRGGYVPYVWFDGGGFRLFLPSNACSGGSES